jgi:hypothetical protein
MDFRADTDAALPRSSMSKERLAQWVTPLMSQPDGSQRGGAKSWRENSQNTTHGALWSFFGLMVVTTAAINKGILQRRPYPLKILLP